MDCASKHTCPRNAFRPAPSNTQITLLVTIPRVRRNVGELDVTTPRDLVGLLVLAGTISAVFFMSLLYYPHYTLDAPQKKRGDSHQINYYPISRVVIALLVGSTQSFFYTTSSPDFYHAIT